MKEVQNITAFVYDRRGRLLSVGRNSYVKTHPLQAKAARATGANEKKIFQHAEVNALVKIKDWSKAHKIVVQRVSPSGKFLNAKPCQCCQWVIDQTGIKVVEHT
jgi:deoxycytidylate deaminase